MINKPIGTARFIAALLVAMGLLLAHTPAPLKACATAAQDPNATLPSKTTPPKTRKKRTPPARTVRRSTTRTTRSNGGDNVNSATAKDKGAGENTDNNSTPQPDSNKRPVIYRTAARVIRVIPRTGTLTIVAEPGASIRLEYLTKGGGVGEVSKNTIPAGERSIILNDLRPGRYRVIAELNGHKPTDSTVLVKAGKSDKVDLNLIPTTTKTTSAPRAGAIVMNQLGMEFAYAPAGSFMMGSDNGDDEEKPAHLVTIREGFYMGRYEVTQVQWQAVMSNTPSYKAHKAQTEVTGALEGWVANSRNPNEPIVGATVLIINLDSQVQTAAKTDAKGHFFKGQFPPGRYKVIVKAEKFRLFEGYGSVHVNVTLTNKFFPLPILLKPLPVSAKAASDFKNCDQCPVEVSWKNAQEFIRRMNARGDGFTYRLPSEAEWEYACRAGTTTEFALGNSLSSEQANFDGNYPSGGAAKGVWRGTTTPVGKFQPNAWGLYDMHGNVWEWCEDVWHENYNGAPLDGSAWLIGGYQENRLRRGGSWFNIADKLRSAVRGQYDGHVGFRLVAVARP